MVGPLNENKMLQFSVIGRTSLSERDILAIGKPPQRKQWAIMDSRTSGVLDVLAYFPSMEKAQQFAELLDELTHAVFIPADERTTTDESS